MVPGELLNDEGKKHGYGTYVDRKDGKIYASRMGILTLKMDTVSVVPLTGCYIPREEDLVIGIITDTAPTFWHADINAPVQAVLHVNDVPWKINFGETSNYLNVSDVILAKVSKITDSDRIQITMKQRNLRKFVGGQLIEVQATKIPRIIGKDQSMIDMLKKYLKIWIFVGKNGRIWLQGDSKSVLLAIEAIRKIEEESHTNGLTDKIKDWLEKVRPKQQIKVENERKNETC